jgi:tripartite motif-containing protein 71
MKRLAVIVVVLASWLAGGERAGAASQFGSYGSQAGQFVEPFGIAVRRDTGDIYVLDTNDHRIERFSKNGVFQFAWGWGVADGKTPGPQFCRRRCFAGLAGAGAGELAFAEGVAIDNDPSSASHGDVYVGDIGNHRVEKFSPDGRFLLTFGTGVNVSARARDNGATEGRCPVRRGDKCGAGLAGTGRGQFEFPVEGSLLAVGPDGTVYVGDRNRVEEFSPQGTYRSQFSLLPTLAGATVERGGVSCLIVDSRGGLYVIRNGVSGVREYAPDGRPLRVFDDRGEPARPEGPAPVVALGRAGQLFIDEFKNAQHQLAEYTADGVRLATFDAGNADALHGLAYSDATGRLYAIATNGNVSPPLARVRLLTPPPPEPFSSFPILTWLATW